MFHRYAVLGGWQMTSRFLVLAAHDGTFWFRFRLFGRLAPGLNITDSRRGHVPFSFRYGIQLGLRLGPFIVTRIGWGLS